MCLFAIFFLSSAKPLMAFEHPAYTIKAQLDVSSKQLEVQQKVRFSNQSARAVEAIYFHVYPNRIFSKAEKVFMQQYASYFKVDPFPDGFQQGKVVFGSIFAENRNLNFSYEGEDQTLLKVELDQVLAPGSSVEVNMEYQLRIPHSYGRFGWHNDIIALSRFYPILAVLSDEGWNKNPFYPFHRPFYSEAAYYQVQLTMPSSWEAIHSGVLKKEKQNGANKQLVIESDHPIREFTVALSPDYRLIEKKIEGVTVKSFYLPGDRDRASEALSHAADLMKFYADLFKPYPYAQFSIAPVYLGYGGEQMSNMILIDTRVYQLPRILDRHFEFLIAHETGHQWFYNLVGIDEFHHMWLEEGVNSYFILQYLEDKYGDNAKVIEWPRPLEWFLPSFSFRRARDFRYKMIARTKMNYSLSGKLSSFKEPSSIFSIAYGKGSAVVAMLKSVAGREAFRKIFQRIFKQYSYRNLSLREFQDICHHESQIDLEYFFDQWLTTTHNCDYAVNGIKDAKVLIENRASIEMPLDVRIDYQDGNSKTIQTGFDDQVKNVFVNPRKKIKRIILDPQKEILDIDRTNNIWPRRIHIKVVPLYLPVHDLAITLPEDSYNVVIGPETSGGGLGLKASLQKPMDWMSYAATTYEFRESIQHTRGGFVLKNVAHQMNSLGFELFNKSDYDGGDQDLVGGKVFFRRELKLAAYSLSDLNDHVSLYFLRNQSLNRGALSAQEDERNISYLKKNEAIWGTALHLASCGPHPDPRQGYRADLILENSNHILGGTQFFYRGSADFSYYYPLAFKSKLAFRLKYGWGFPDDKNLYELGGWDGLRGYDRKTLRGSHVALGALELRFPLLQNINVSFADNILRLDEISGVVFAETGQNWFDDMDETTLRKDAGGGLRFIFSVGSFLEKVMVRVDVAQAINDSSEETKVWAGVNHAF